MAEQSGWWATFTADLNGAAGAFVGYLPDLLAGLALLLLGWLVALAARVGARRLAQGVGWLLPRVLPGGERYRASLTANAPVAIAELVFWLVIVAFAAAASRLLGLALVADWLDRVLDLLPVLAAGAVLLGVGLLLGRLARQRVAAAASASGIELSELLGTGVHIAIALTAAAIALDVIGVDITLLVVAASVVLGAAAVGLALAFGLGAREHASNLLAARQLRGLYQPGDTIRIAGHEGQIVELTDCGVVLDTADGRVHLPARYILVEPCTLVMREGVHD